MADGSSLNSERLRIRKGQRCPVIVVYDAPFARCAQQAGIDVLIVGDSLATVVFGCEASDDITIVEMQRHAQAVRCGAPRAHIIVDIPAHLHRYSSASAIVSAAALAAAGADSVKLEGGRAITSCVKSILSIGVPVIGHLNGLGQDDASLRADACKLEAAGITALVLKNIDPRVAEQITMSTLVPTIGIGSGPHCDAQVVVSYDALGLTRQIQTTAGGDFAKLSTTVTEAMHDYAQQVRSGYFPPQESSGQTGPTRR